MKGHRARIISAALACLAGVLLGALGTSVLMARESALQAGASRRVIRPDKAPNIGLPFSPGIRIGNTLYVAGHLGRDPVSSKLVTGGIEAPVAPSHLAEAPRLAEPPSGWPEGGSAGLPGRPIAFGQTVEAGLHAGIDPMCEFGGDPYPCARYLLDVPRPGS